MQDVSARGVSPFAIGMIMIFCGMRCGGTLSTPTGGDDDTPEVFADVALFGNTTCGLTNKGRVYCWGSVEQSGQAATSITPVLYDSLPETESLESFGSGVCGVTSGGTRFWCFGSSMTGMFGDGVASGNYFSTAPYEQLFTAFVGTAATFGSAYSGTRCVVKQSGALMCWGNNIAGSIGDNTTSSRYQPTAVSTAEVFTQVSSGGDHSCGVTVAGGVYCWGDGADGRLGDSSAPTDSLVPVAVNGLSGAAVEVYAGERNTCARMASGTVQCWGFNSNGALGDNNACGGTCATPQTAVGITTVTQLTTVGQSSIALLADGTLRCWGTNLSGQFGTGVTTALSRPTACATALTSVQKIRMNTSGGGTSTCAVLQDGTAMCWGRNSNGQAGVSTAAGATILTPDTVISVP